MLFYSGGKHEATGVGSGARAKAWDLYFYLLGIGENAWEPNQPLERSKMWPYEKKTHEIEPANVQNDARTRN